jgi:two-component system chemotaxis response regulator CheY
VKILIVDDDAVHRRLLRAQITRAGHEVIEASDGQDAWEQLQSESIPFVITDWVMPRMSGIELTRHIREADAPFYTYVILLSVRADRGDVVDGLESGVDDYLIKPCDSRELRSRIAIGMRILTLEARLRESRDQLQQIATHDSLTELLNRRAVYEEAQKELARASRKHACLSLVLLDIDHFKSINDRYGHPMGDEALRLVAATITRSLRPYDKVGRWGGEEFLVVLPGTDSEDALSVAERIRQNIATTVLPLGGGNTLVLHASLGVASALGIPALEIGTLISQADNALYQAKHEGRNRVCLFSA